MPVNVTETDGEETDDEMETGGRYRDGAVASLRTSGRDTRDVATPSVNDATTSANNVVPSLSGKRRRRDNVDSEDEAPAAKRARTVDVVRRGVPNYDYRPTSLTFIRDDHRVEVAPVTSLPFEAFSGRGYSLLGNTAPTRRNEDVREAGGDAGAVVEDERIDDEDKKSGEGNGDGRLVDREDNPVRGWSCVIA